ncbi:hypothetical protein OG760_35655 [Streptomyces sp. NBC_00963]|nr:hypothetical protein OG760_35655 [Streptomyces sp. NBC_00963]
MDNGVLDPVIVTGFHATRTHKLTPGQKTANRVLANGRAPVEHGFAHLKNWRILTKLRTEPARATCLLPPARPARPDEPRSQPLRDPLSRQSPTANWSVPVPGVLAHCQ